MLSWWRPPASWAALEDSTAGRLKEVVLPFYWTLVRMHLKSKSGIPSTGCTQKYRMHKDMPVKGHKNDFSRMDWSTWDTRRNWESGSVPPWESGSGGSYLSKCIILDEGRESEDDRFFLVVPSDRVSVWTTGNLIYTLKIFTYFYCEGAQTVKRVA